jgi:hypothetical protein
MDARYSNRSPLSSGVCPMSSNEDGEDRREIIAYNLNPYVLGILVLSVGLWVFGHTESATLALLAFVFVFVIRNMWFAYSRLLG